MYLTLKGFASQNPAKIKSVPFPALAMILSKRDTHSTGQIPAPPTLRSNLSLGNAAAEGAAPLTHKCSSHHLTTGDCITLIYPSNR